MTGPGSAAAVARATTGDEATTHAAFTHKVAGAYGTLFYNEDDGAWQFDPDNAAIDALDAGETPSDVFSVTVSDGTATSTAQALTINITGVNDQPAQLADIAPPAVADTAFTDTSFVPIEGTFPAVTDAEGDTYKYVVQGEDDIAIGAGALLDTVARHQGFTQDVVGDYGTLYYNENNGKWKYVVDAAAVDALADGATATDTFSRCC